MNACQVMRLAKELQHGWTLLKQMQKDMDILSQFSTLKKRMSDDCWYPYVGGATA
jgi:hypothetical protein